MADTSSENCLKNDNGKDDESCNQEEVYAPSFAQLRSRAKKAHLFSAGMSYFIVAYSERVKGLKHAGKNMVNLGTITYPKISEEQWKIDEIEPGLYTIQAVGATGNKRYLSTNDKGKLDLFNFVSEKNKQKWKINPLPMDNKGTISYTIESAHTTLGTKRFLSHNSRNVVDLFNYRTDKQRWVLLNVMPGLCDTWTVELRKIWKNESMTDDSHHLHIRELEVFDGNGHKLPLRFNSASPGVLEGEQGHTVFKAIDGDYDTTSHSRYKNVDYSDHFMKFNVQGSFARIGEVKLHNRLGDWGNRILGCQLSLNNGCSTVTYEIHTASDEITWVVAN